MRSSPEGINSKSWFNYNMNETTKSFKKRRRAGTQRINDYFAELFTGMKADRGCRTLLYNLLHVVRRLVFVWVAVDLHKQPWIQAILFIVASLLVCVYLFSEMPFESNS